MSRAAEHLPAERAEVLALARQNALPRGLFRIPIEQGEFHTPDLAHSLFQAADRAEEADDPALWDALASILRYVLNDGPLSARYSLSSRTAAKLTQRLAAMVTPRD